MKLWSIGPALPAAVLVMAVVALSGCATGAPRHFYTLVPALEPAAAPDADWYFELLPVSVPAQVDVPQLVLRQSAGELALAETRLWAAPLGDEIRDALSVQLMQRLGAADRFRVAVAESAERVRIKVDVRGFDSRLDDQAAVSAAWSLSSSVDGEPLTCSAGFQVPVRPGYPGLVAGHQEALSQLAEAIALSVERLRAGSRDCGPERVQRPV